MAKRLRAVKRARLQRRQMSMPEVLLWQRLRGDPQGVRFRRQHPIGPFVVDFFCARAKLVIEVDGIVHSMGDQPEFDEKRTGWLAAQGVDVLRIPASDVLRDPDEVASSLLRHVMARCG